MAKLLKPQPRKQGSYQRCWIEVHGKKHRINIGYVSNERTTKIFDVVETLEAKLFEDKILSPEDRRKLDKIAQDHPNVYKRLIKVGLIKNSDRPETVNELTKYWLNEVVKGTVKPETLDNYANTLKSGLEKHFGEKLFAQITKGDVQEFIAKLKKKYEDSTIGNFLKRANAVFRFAVDKEWINDNPFDLGSGAEKFAIRINSEKAERQTELMTEEAINKLLNCRKSPDVTQQLELDAFVYLLRYTGCRESSAFILRWSDINFEDNEITMRAKANSKAKSTKGSDRPKRILTMPLWPQMKPVLLKLKQHQPEGTKYVLNKVLNLETKPEFTLLAKKGGTINKGRWVQNLNGRFHAIFEQNNIEKWPQLLHAFHMYRGNELEREGYPEAQIDAWIGNTKETRARHYDREAIKVTSSDRQNAVLRSSQDPATENASGRMVADRPYQDASDRPSEKHDPQKTAGKTQSDTDREDPKKERVHPRGFEPLTFGSVDRCSIQLS